MNLIKQVTLFLTMMAVAEVFGQTSPQIFWNDSFQLPKDLYTFQKVSRSDSGLHIEASGKKHYYSFTVSQGVLDQKIYPKEKKVFWLYQDQGEYGPRSIARKHVEKNIHRLILKEENNKEQEIFSFRESAESIADIHFIESDSVLHVILLAEGKFYDTAEIMHAVITPQGEIIRHYHRLEELSRLTKVLHIQVEQQKVTFLIKTYHINKIEKRAFSRNYQYEIIQVDLKSAVMETIKIPLLDSFFYPKAKYNARTGEVFGTYGYHSSNRAQGIFTFNISKNSLHHYPFDHDIIQNTRKPIEFWKRKNIYALYPDMIFESEQSRFYFLEQYYVKLVGGPVEKPLYHLFYNHIIMATLSKETGKMDFVLLPKYQKTFNDAGQISSYLLLKTEGKTGILFNSGIKYLKAPRKNYAFHHINHCYWAQIQSDSTQFKIFPLSSDPLLTGLVLPKGEGDFEVFSYKKRILKIGILSLK